jgi:uncharacterized membrane protein
MKSRIMKPWQCSLPAWLSPSKRSTVKPLVQNQQHDRRFLLAVFFVVAGLLHFVFPHTYIRMVPPSFPWPGTLVWFSGAAEIIGGAGLLLPPWRRPAAWGLVLLLLAVFPANIYMAMANVPFAGLLGKSWALWLRLPLQIPLIYWAWRYTRD